MKTRFLIQMSALGIAAVLCSGVVGCKKKSHVGPGPGTEGIGPVTVGGGLIDGRIGTPAIGERNQPPRLAADTVYFAFDSASVNPSERHKLDDMVAFLRENARTVITVEGHCDERGTAEYNRSLGERRAQACREYLTGTGVDAGRVQTISYGKDKPADPGHNEEAWAKNRRAEFIITAQ